MEGAAWPHGGAFGSLQGTIQTLPACQDPPAERDVASPLNSPGSTALIYVHSCNKGGNGCCPAQVWNQHLKVKLITRVFGSGSNSSLPSASGLHSYPPVTGRWRGSHPTDHPWLHQMLHTNPIMVQTGAGGCPHPVLPAKLMMCFAFSSRLILGSAWFGPHRRDRLRSSSRCKNFT